MKQFVVIYYAPISAMDQIKYANSEDMKKSMEDWMK